MFGACTESSPANEMNPPLIADTITKQEPLLTIQEDTVKTATIEEDLIELSDLNNNPALANYVDYIDQVMKNISNPVRVKYVGCDFGDYFHLSFTGPDDLYLDFGDGNNDFGDYELYDPLTFEDDPAYLDKTFDLHWEYKASSFYCCEGAMEDVTAIIPSIVKLELIEN